jgi:hypothetical protein
LVALCVKVATEFASDEACSAGYQDSHSARLFAVVVTKSRLCFNGRS